MSALLQRTIFGTSLTSRPADSKKEKISETNNKPKMKYVAQYKLLFIVNII